MFRSTKAGYKQHLKTNEMIGVIEKAIEVVEKAAETSSEIKEAAKSKDISAVSKFENASMQFKEGLSDEALKARVEAAAHSANKFFGIPDIDLVEGDAIGVYRNCDIFLDKDVFEYSLDQFKDMKCLSFEDMTKVWAHECGHRILRMDFPSGWTQELGADFFSGVRSEMLGLPTSNFEKLLASTTGSVTHPVGSLRIQAIQFGRDVVRGLQEKGITPTIENCKEAFANSPFAKITYENYTDSQYAALTDGKEKFSFKEKMENNPNETKAKSLEGFEDADSPRRIKTINDDLAGQLHPETKVAYVEKTVTTDTGERVVGTFPEFDSKFDVQLPENLEKASDREQFAECNRQLKEKCENDPRFKSQFNSIQLEDINSGRTPCGYTWHHNEEKGKMQLVDFITHWNTRHTGGKAIWGGGIENR